MYGHRKCTSANFKCEPDKQHNTTSNATERRSERVMPREVRHAQSKKVAGILQSEGKTLPPEDSVAKDGGDHVQRRVDRLVVQGVSMISEHWVNFDHFH